MKLADLEQCWGNGGGGGGEEEKSGGIGGWGEAFKWSNVLRERHKNTEPPLMKLAITWPQMTQVIENVRIQSRHWICPGRLVWSSICAPFVYNENANKHFIPKVFIWKQFSKKFLIKSIKFEKNMRNISIKKI